MRACVLSGGGSKGAFQLGVLRQLLDTEDIDYDIYSGISVGALNGSQLATGPLKDTLPKLEDVWFNQVKGNTSVWRHHIWYYIIFGICVILLFTILAFVLFILDAPKAFTIISGLLALCSFYLPWYSLNNAHSIYTTEPLRELIEDNLDLDGLKSSGKKLIIGAVSFTTGSYKSVDENVNNIVDWIMASSAFPIFFPKVQMDGQYWGDGGVTELAPLEDAIHAGATEIDIILASPLHTTRYKGLPGILKQIPRELDIMQLEILRNDIISRCRNLDIKVRIFMPETSLTRNPLSFSPDRIKKMYDEGKQIAAKTNDI